MDGKVMGEMRQSGELKCFKERSATFEQVARDSVRAAT